MKPAPFVRHVPRTVREATEMIAEFGPQDGRVLAGGQSLVPIMAFRMARQERPFTIDAIVILPDHLHAIWTLPSGDSDFSGRWRRIKAYFTHRLVAAGVPVKRHRNGEYALWQRRF